MKKIKLLIAIVIGLFALTANGQSYNFDNPARFNSWVSFRQSHPGTNAHRLMGVSEEGPGITGSYMNYVTIGSGLTLSGGVLSSSGGGSVDTLNFWNLRGNTITGNKWFGTNNSRSIHIRTNGIERAQFDSLGYFQLQNLFTGSDRIIGYDNTSKRLTGLTVGGGLAISNDTLKFTVTGSGLCGDSLLGLRPNGTIGAITVGGGLQITSCGLGLVDSLNYSPWDTTATAIIQKNTTLNVGVGTASPASKLDITGSFNQSVTDTFAGYTIVNGMYSKVPEGILLQSMGSGTGNFNGNLAIEPSVTSLLHTTDTSNTKIALSDTGFVFTTFGGDAMVVKNNGNVGIGVSTPTYKLQVADSINGNVLKLNAAQGSNYATFNLDAGNGLLITAGTTGIAPQFFINPNTGDIELSTGSAAGVTRLVSNIVGIGPGTPQSVLDVQSTTSGVILPRVSTAERDAFSNPINGMIIYNVDTDKFQGYAAGAWADLN